VAGSLKDTIWKTFDLEDERVLSWQRSTSEEEVANRWILRGKPFHLDLYVTPRIKPFDSLAADQVRERDMLDYDVPVGGTFDGLEGARLEFVAHGLAPGDAGAAGFPAGLVQEASEALQDDHAVASVVRNSAANTDLFLEEVLLGDMPTPGYLVGHLTNDTALRIRDAEDRSQTSSRESVTKVIDDATVDGAFLANLRALRDLFATVRNARRARLIVNNWRGPPGDQLRNVIGILEGNTRVTRYGTTGEGGDGYVYQQDERPIGTCRRYEVRAVDAAWLAGGWELAFTLGSAPQDLASRIRPEALS
jgi:hypothetical protein